MDTNNQIEVKGFVIQPRLTFKNRRDKMIYQLLVEEANYRESDKCKQGQTIISITSLEEDTGWSRGQIRGSLNRLKEAGYISTETMPRNRGLLITITNYSEFQSLETYKNNQQITNKQPTDNQQDNQQTNSENQHGYSVSDGSKNENNQQDNQQITNKQPTDNQTRTSFKQQVNNNEHIKDLRGNFSDVKHFELFVDLAEQINPLGLNKKILINYFDVIRMTRKTCRISANVCIRIWEKLQKYKDEPDKLHYALLTHTLNHDDKGEEYTFGIIRNTSPTEARRKMIRLLNTDAREGFAYERTTSNSRQFDPNELDELSL